MKRFYIILILSLSFCLPSACSDNNSGGGAQPAPPAQESSDAAAAGEAPSAVPDGSANDAVPPPAPQEIPLYDDYQASLDIDPSTRVINGIERVRFTNRGVEPLEEIVMRTYLNAFKETEPVRPYFDVFESVIFPNGKDYGYMNILHVSLDNDELNYTLDGTVLNIELDEPLPPEQTVQIKLQFDAYIPRMAHRTGANDNALWCGAFLPVLAVRDAAGWHTEPYYPAGDPFYLEAANYTVEITTPEGYEVAGTGTKRVEDLDDKQISIFTAKMTRGFSFAVSNLYRVAEAVSASGVPIMLYYYSDGVNADELLQTAVRAMDYYEGFVGEYPYSQLCFAETDIFLRYMAFAKIIFIDTGRLQRAQPPYVNLVREMGQQWFYHVVGNNAIAEPWLYKGLALFMQECFAHETEESLTEAMEAEYISFRDAMEQTEFTSPRRLAVDLSVYDDWSGYYTIQCTKAKLMIYALRKEMGVEAFDIFIKEYYKAFSFKLADRAAFVAKAEEIHGAPLDLFFNKWLYGEELP